MLCGDALVSRNSDRVGALRVGSLSDVAVQAHAGFVAAR